MEEEVSEAVKGLKEILLKCQNFKGRSSSPTLSAMLEKVKIDLGVHTLKERFKQENIMQTAEKIHRLKKNFPNILSTIYNEDRDRMKGETEDDILVLKAFEQRKSDMKYINMLEKKKTNKSKK